MSQREVKIIGKNSVPVLLRSADEISTISVSVKSISFSNVGAANSQVLGTILKPGETVNFNAEVGNHFSAGIFDYRSTGTELLIAYII